MPSRKIFSLLIICFGIVVSFWFFHKPAGTLPSTGIGENQINPIPYQKPLITAQSGDWQKILVSVSKATTTDVTKQNSALDVAEGTMTDQMAKDFMSQYLIAKQGGAELTSDQINQIAQNTLANQDYTKAVGVEYTVKDLNINQNTDSKTATVYQNNVSQAIASRAPKNAQDVTVITQNAMDSGNPNDLLPLDPIIASTQGLISDLLKISVPADAVNVHLELLNALSNLLDNTEAMRQAFVDPVRSFAALSLYDQHTADLQTALQDINAYFSSKNK